MAAIQALPSVANSRIWRRGEQVDDDVTVEDLEAAVLDPETLTWVDLVAPTPAELDAVATRLGLRATAVEDALAAHERPKVTRHPDHLFFTVYATRMRRPEDAPPLTGRAEAAVPDEPPEDAPDARLVTDRISGFVLPSALITVRLDERIDMARVLGLWEDNADLLQFGPGALVHGLLDAVVDGHFDTIQQLDDVIEDLEDELFAERAHGRDFVRRTYAIRKDLVALRRVVLPMREVVGALQRHRPTSWAEGLASEAGAANGIVDGVNGADKFNRSDGFNRSDLDAWFDDLYDHVLRASEWTESLRDLIGSVFETNLSLQDQRLNDIMKQLAAWAAIIAVPTAITGWFGQNVPYPGFAAPWGVWLTTALIVLCSVGLYAAFKRRGWL